MDCRIRWRSVAEPIMDRTAVVPISSAGTTGAFARPLSSQMKDDIRKTMVKENGEPYIIKDSREMRNCRKQVAQQLKKKPPQD
jgi:hypothetical protein